MKQRLLNDAHSAQAYDN